MPIILLVDDHRMVRESFAHLIETQKDLKVLWQCDSYCQVEALPASPEPDLALIDISLPEKNGLEVQRLCHQRWPKVKTVIVSMYEQHHYVSEAMAQGARGYVTKRAASEEILTAIYAALDGSIHLSQEMMQSLYISQSKEQEVSRLTPRELHICQLLVQGHSVKKIAQLTQTMPKTVFTHRANIYKKLGISNQHELLKLGFKTGLLHPEML